MIEMLKEHWKPFWRSPGWTLPVGILVIAVFWNSWGVVLLSAAMFVIIYTVTMYQWKMDRIIYEHKVELAAITMYVELEEDEGPFADLPEEQQEKYLRVARMVVS